MARTPEQIEREYIESIENSDPSWDTTQGPIREIFTIPLSGITSRTETEAENLRKLFSLNFDETITEEEVQQALKNYGSQPGEGTRAKHIQTFLRFTKPREDITIPAGTLVSNNSGNLIYRTLNEVVMLSSQPDVYYNSTRKAYEISVEVEADGIGSEYSLSAYRVQTILSSVIGIDATENKKKSSQGLASESVSEQSNRLKDTLLGLNLNTQGGIPKRIRDVLPNTISLSQVVTPADPEFKRVQFEPSIDIYILGTDEQSVTETITGITDMDEIIPLKQPVISVNSIILNGNVQLSGTLIKDDSNETGNSIRATDIIKLDVPLNNNDVVEYTYTYNKAIEDVSTLVFNDASESLFRTDYLIREFLRPSPYITMELKVLASYSFEEVSASVYEAIQNEFSKAIIRDRLSPSELRDQITGEVSGIQKLRITKFRRDSGSVSNIETIVLGLNEVLEYNEDRIIVKAIK